MILARLNLINADTGKITEVRRTFSTDSMASVRVKIAKDIAEFNGMSVVIDSPMRQELVAIEDYVW